jgi:assimilatory nitrate reductase catalytic subunit
MRFHADPPKPVRTTCPYCGVGCGILARHDAQGVTIAGDLDHPANFGRLCSKGAALGETLGLEGRLLHPKQRDATGELARADWDAALDSVAHGLKRVIAQDGPDAVGFYLSGQLLTEDYYVANKLMKGFIGSANVDTNSRLCMASAVAGHRRAFGADIVPGSYDDLDEADLIVLVGSNAAWCHPILFQRMVKNRRERGAKIVVIDPRATATAEEADLFLAIAPGQDVALFCGLLVALASKSAINRGFIEDHTMDFENTLSAARVIAPDVAATAVATGLDAADVARFFDLFCMTERVVTCFSQGVNQSAQGTDKVNAIINCHLTTGRIGKPGRGPFSLTGQPNAMGGREVGGLANQLAAHMSFVPGDIERVARFWNAPRMARREGLKAVQMFEAIERGEIKALWVMGTNPAVSLPRAGAMRDALRRLELFIVSDTVASNDTMNAGAHVLLPAAAWGERDGTLTNSERRISRQRPFLPLPDEAKPDWWIVSETARRMGFATAFPYRAPADVFREHAALSAFENDGARAFDISGLATLSDAAYDQLAPAQWPIRSGQAGADTRFFAKGRYFTPDGKARFVAPELPALKTATSDEFPYRLNTGRIRDQWHTMTRTGRSPRLALHMPEPFVEIHPDDAFAAGVVDGGFARLTTQYGSCILKVAVSGGQQRGSLFAPIHWSDETASSARIGDLVAPHTDPHSGQPESKATPAVIAPVAFVSRGFVMARQSVELPDATWWARAALAGGWGYLLASNDTHNLWRRWVRSRHGADAEYSEYLDAPRGLFRTAVFVSDRLEFCLFIGPAGPAPQWDAVKPLFAGDSVDAAQRRYVLSGKAANGVADPGPVICACFGVGLAAIRDAVESRLAANVEEIGKALRAGTNCGSCLPELKRIVGRNGATDRI